MKLVALVAALLTTPAAASSVTVTNPLVLQGVVYSQMPGMADELLKRAAASPSVDLVINSPGGSVIHGLIFINAMEAARTRGTKLRCFVTNLAASMAFQILAHCDERYAYKFSLLLWHPVRVGGMLVLTPDAAASLASDLRRIEQVLVEDLRARFEIDSRTFWYHYNQETLFTAVEVQAFDDSFIRVVDNMQGMDAVTSVGQEGEFDGSVPQGEIWYIK